MQRRRLDELHRPLKKPPANQNQMEFAFAA